MTRTDFVYYLRIYFQNLVRVQVREAFPARVRVKVKGRLFHSAKKSDTIIIVPFIWNVTLRPRFFYLLGYISLSGISKCRDQKKNEIKIEQNVQSYYNIRSIICINYLYSKKIVNLSPKDQMMCIYFNFNHFK